MNKPPAYVSIILPREISLYGNLSVLRDKGLKVRRRIIGGSIINFSDDEKGYFKNIDLLEKLMKLNELGVAFSEDYKQAYSPAVFMRELHIMGILKKSFMSIEWTGNGEWRLKENFP